SDKNMKFTLQIPNVGVGDSLRAIVHVGLESHKVLLSQNFTQRADNTDNRSYCFLQFHTLYDDAKTVLESYGEYILSFVESFYSRQTSINIFEDNNEIVDFRQIEHSLEIEQEKNRMLSIRMAALEEQIELRGRMLFRYQPFKDDGQFDPEQWVDGLVVEELGPNTKKMMDTMRIKLTEEITKQFGEKFGDDRKKLERQIKV
ncbi:MAG: hypothetical protein EZS28_046713, partial [Streblomastix strix]